MNAHKAAVKTAKAYKANIRNERYWTKVGIKNADYYGKGCIIKTIYYTENLDWLKKNGFKYTNYLNYKNLYIISWKDC